MINGKIHYKWSFSIAMLNYQRVYPMGDNQNKNMGKKKNGKKRQHLEGLGELKLCPLLHWDNWKPL